MRLSLLPVALVVALVGCGTKKSDDSQNAPTPEKKSDSQTPSNPDPTTTQTKDQPKDGPQVTVNDPAFADLIKSHSVTVTFNGAAASRLADTVGAPSYQIAYVQSGSLVKQADLVNGNGQKFCSMAAKSFVTANVAYDIKADKVKGRNLFGNAILDASNIGDIVTISCEKIAAESITLKDLQDIFGTLATITVSP